MNYLDQNMETLKRYNCDLYEEVKEYLQNNTQENKVECITTRSGALSLKINSQNVNLTLHSTYDPVLEAERFIEAQSESIQGKDTLVIFGLGAGYVVEQCIKKYPHLNKIVFEYDMEIFANILKNKDCSNILGAKNVALYIGMQEGQMKNELKVLFSSKLVYNLCFLETTPYKRLFGETIDRVERDFADFFKAYTVNLRTLQAFNKVWIYNFLSNIRHLPHASNTNGFMEKFKDIPAVIVGSGPSLKKNMHLLDTIQDKALVISAGSSIGVIQAIGVVPHMNLSIDGGQAMSNDINNIEKQEEILLAYLNNVHYDCINKYRGRKLYVKSISEKAVDYFEEFVGNKTQPVGFGGSCVTVALDFAYQLGCNPLILIGVDLAYTDMKTHVDGILERQDIDKVKEDCVGFFKMKDIHGNDTYTGSNLFSTLMAANDYMKDRKEHRTFINATEGGLPMEHALHMRLEEVLEKYCIQKHPLAEIIDACFSVGAEENKKNSEKIKVFYEHVYQEAKDLLKYSEKRIKLAKDAINKLNKGNTANLAELRTKMDKITKKIEGSQLFKGHIYFLTQEVIDAIRNKTQKEAMQKTDTVDKLKVLYDGLNKQYEYIEEKVALTLKVCEEFKG